MRKNSSTSGCSAFAERYWRMNGVCWEKSSWLMRSKLEPGSNTVEASPNRQVCEGGERVWHGPPVQAKRLTVTAPGGAGAASGPGFQRLFAESDISGSNVPGSRGKATF